MYLIILNCLWSKLHWQYLSCWARNCCIKCKTLHSCYIFYMLWIMLTFVELLQYAHIEFSLTVCCIT
jgi:hypothetical protein